MSKRDLLSILDLSSKEITELLRQTAKLKARWNKGKMDFPLKGKTLGLIFQKPSTRTRVSFETAMFQLGGSTIFMSSQDMQLSRGETISDTSRVLSRYVQALAVRTYEQEFVAEMAASSSIPVINALTDLYHPCQILSDMFTVMERKKELEGLRIAWIGDGNNVAHSWINAAVRKEFTLILACPGGYEPQEEILSKARETAGDRIVLTHDPMEAAEEADVINTDVWISMGQDTEEQQRLEAFRGFQINRKLVSRAKPDAMVLHCLPAHRDQEISSEILDDPQSAIFDQAENKMHLHKAVLYFLIGGELEK